MQPNADNKDQPIEARSSAPAITGSQLEAQATAAAWQKTQKKLKIGIAIGAGVLLLGIGIIALIFLTTKPHSSDVAQTNAANKTGGATAPATQPQATQAESKYTEKDYQSSDGQGFRVTYFSNAQAKHYCELALHSQCLPPVTSTVYLSGSRDSRQPLLFSIEDATTVSQPDYCPAVAFTATLNSKATPVCKQDLGGKVFQYTFTFTIKGKEYVGTFIMDNPASGTFLDASQYEKDIQIFVPAVKVYL